MNKDFFEGEIGEVFLHQFLLSGQDYGDHNGAYFEDCKRDDNRSNPNDTLLHFVVNCIYTTLQKSKGCEKKRDY